MGGGPSRAKLPPLSCGGERERERPSSVAATKALVAEGETEEEEEGGGGGDDEEEAIALMELN